MVDKRQPLPKALSRVALVLELEVPRDRPYEWVRVVASRPGRDGTMNRVWALGAGVLTPSQAEDIMVWMNQSIMNAIETMGGIQGVLF